MRRMAGPIPYCFVILFWAAALVVSGTLGYFCLEAHGLPKEKLSSAVRNHQRWFNFTGAFVGWVALWCLVRRGWGVWRLPSSSGQLTWSDFALGFVAFVGVSGYLPYGTKSTLDALRELAVKTLDRVLKLMTGE